jgi:membrane protein implicated in regulation of membrane protease activity
MLLGTKEPNMPFVLDYWHWYILGVALVTIEMLVPTFFALWIGISALLTGTILYFVPSLAWEYQVLIFAILSVVSVVTWHQYYVKNPIATDEPLLNRRGEQYIGRIITIKAPIEDGQGKISIDDSTWKIRGLDCPIGTKVKLVALDNVIFDVDIVE